MKTYILGTGGVGGYFGGLMAKAGEEVTFVARGENYKALKEHGLDVKSVVGDFEVKPMSVIESISEIVNPELILLTVKTYDTEKVTKELAAVINPDTIIITFQNGVDNDLKIKNMLSIGHVYPGVAYVISAKTEPGVISQTGGLRKLIFGDRNNQNNIRLKEVETFIKRAGIDGVLSEDITFDLWKKFLFIIPMAGMTAMYRKIIGELLSDPEIRHEYEQCLKEAIVVGKNMGVKFGDDIFESIMTISDNTAKNSKSSLLVDLENGRPTEIETLQGTLLRMAKEKNVSVPINEKIYKNVALQTNKVK